MKEEIEQILAEVRDLKCKTEKDIEDARVRLLGKKGEITKLFEEFRAVDPELKKEFIQVKRLCNFLVDFNYGIISAPSDACTNAITMILQILISLAFDNSIFRKMTSVQLFVINVA